MNELLTGAWSEAIREAKATFKTINARGSRWKNRTVPIFIRKNLMVPWYVIPGDSGNYRLFVIRYPTTMNNKVHFVEYQGGQRRPTSQTEYYLAKVPLPGQF